MERIWKPADQLLAGVGRFVRSRPKLTGLLVLMIIVFTLINNGLLPFSAEIKPPVQTLVLPELDEVRLDNSSIGASSSILTPQLSKLPQSPKPANLTELLPTPYISIAHHLPSFAYFSGKIHRNILYDAHKIGLPIRQALTLQHLFSKASPKPGDTFDVLYGQQTSGKKSIKTIVAAELFHLGKRFALIRFVDSKGHAEFYTPQGESLREGILRAPLARYTYISSLFSRSRLEPILHFRRPHLGVDYAAPTGTPILAAANGTVVEMHAHGGYGNVIVLKHANYYSTLYAHMSQFAANLHVGSAVNRGQIIGYVGQTGLATGPHLHYEIHVHDVAENPLTVPLPGLPIDTKYRNAFLAQSKKLMSEFHADKDEVSLAEKTDSSHRS